VLALSVATASVEEAVRLALGHAARHDAGSGAVGNRQAVTQQEDDVLGLRRFGGAEHVPGNRLGFAAGLGDDFVGARLGDGHALEADRRRVGIGFLFDEFDLAAQHILGRLAVDRDRHVAFSNHAVKLDLHVERRAGEDRCTIERIDGGGAGDRGGCQTGRCSHEGEQAAHGLVLRMVRHKASLASAHVSRMTVGWAGLLQQLRRGAENRARFCQPAVQRAHGCAMIGRGCEMQRVTCP
jgi:hypothetical protein